MKREREREHEKNEYDWKFAAYFFVHTQTHSHTYLPDHIFANFKSVRRKRWLNDAQIISELPFEQLGFLHLWRETMGVFLVYCDSSWQYSISLGIIGYQGISSTELNFQCNIHFHQKPSTDIWQHKSFSFFFFFSASLVAAHIFWCVSLRVQCVCQ